MRAPSAAHNCSGVARNFLIGQSGQCYRIRFSISQRLQHAPGTGAEQIGDQAGQLDMSLFQ